MAWYDKVLVITFLQKVVNKILYRLGVKVEVDCVILESLCILSCQWLVVCQECIRLAHVSLSLMIVASVDCFVRTLEQAHLAVLNQLDAWVLELRIEVANLSSRDCHRCRDVVLNLYLEAWYEIAAQFVE